MNRYILILSALLALSTAAMAAPQSPFVVEPLQEQIEIAAGQRQVTVGVQVHLPTDHYLYVEKTDFTPNAMQGVEVGPLQAPESATKYDPYIKKNLKIYPGTNGELIFKRTLTLPAEVAASYIVQATFKYQGCSPKICFLPASKSLSMRLISAESPTSDAASNNGDWDFAAITKRGLLWALLLAFLGGLASSLTPCVYPMIPITIAVIGAKQAKTKRQALGLGLTFAGGLALTYALLGVGAALSGAILGAALQSKWVLLGIATVFIGMGLSMLGVFEFRLPYFVNRLVAGVEGGSGKMGVFITGAITGIVAAPCVGPVILGILTFVATSRDALLGFGLLFCFALGLSLLFVVLGVFSSWLSRLPKSGSWMEIVKHLFGALLIAVGLYYVRPALPPLLFSMILLVAIVLFAWYTRLKALFGAKASVIVFSLLLIAGGGLLFGTIIPELGRRYATNTTDGESENGIVWETKLEAALEKAKREKRPVMVDFYADWCIACKELDAQTYSDAKVIELSKRFINVKLDFTQMNSENQKVLTEYGVMALPAILFFDTNGVYQPAARIDGFIDPESMAARLQSLL